LSVKSNQITCIKVPKTDGEKAVALTNKLGVLEKSFLIQRDEHDLCIPLVRQLLETELSSFKEQIPKLELVTSFFKEKKHVPETFLQAIQHKLPVTLLSSVPKSFDIIGDIVVIDIPPELKLYRPLIGDAILRTHKNIRTVLSKESEISGTYRVRDYSLVAGENKTKTIHKEFGCLYHVDIAKAFFSPRLSHEHERVASLVQPGEVVVDLFAGVGPFSILIGKKNPKTRVYALDLNPEAVELLRVNVRVNKVEKQVFPILGDSKETARTQLLKGTADRAIMNLPETAIDFVDAACNVIKKKGGVAHFYGFIRTPESIDNFKERFTELVETNGRKVGKILYAKKIRETAPFESQVVLDAKIL
jgi:tRNA (guanine37-N1)-methyltransferase